MTKRKITAEDCRSCGACCVSGGDGSDVLAHGYREARSAFDELSFKLRQRPS